MDILPDSRLKDHGTGHPKGSKEMVPGWWWVPIFCANCGQDGGLVPEQTTSGAFYLCDPCEAAYGTIPGMAVMPDEVFWQRVQDETMEHYGRLLTPQETMEQLADPASLLSRLARDRAALTPAAGG